MPGNAASAADAGAPVETDVVVIGAGPVGLFQAFQLGLQGLAVQVVDSLPHAGGQCVELYPDKPIYDIPAVPLCTGRTLVQQLLAQSAPFHQPMHLGHEVSTLAPHDDGRFDLATARGLRLVARSVVIAGGVGSFQPRRLQADGLDAHAGRQLRYALDDVAACAGQHVVVVGGGEDALETVIRLAHAEAPRAASISLIHRRDAFQASAEAIERVQALRAAGGVRFIAGQTQGAEADGDRLTALTLLDASGATQRVPLDLLLVRQGLSPKLGPIAHWGLAIERKQVVVDTERFETSVPGLFAVGDVNTYPGKRRLIVCGFHEATLAAFAVAARHGEGAPVPLLYTTTSPVLHRRLGLPPSDR